MENQPDTQAIFDAGISLSAPAAERLSAVMEAEGKKRFWPPDGSNRRWLFRHELRYVLRKGTKRIRQGV